MSLDFELHIDYQRLWVMRDERDTELRFIFPESPEDADEVRITLGDFLSALGITLDDCQKALAGVGERVA